MKDTSSLGKRDVSCNLWFAILFVFSFFILTLACGLWYKRGFQSWNLTFLSRYSKYANICCSILLTCIQWHWFSLTWPYVLMLSFCLGIWLVKPRFGFAYFDLIFMSAITALLFPEFLYWVKQRICDWWLYQPWSGHTLAKYCACVYNKVFKILFNNFFGDMLLDK